MGLNKGRANPMKGESEKDKAPGKEKPAKEPAANFFKLFGFADKWDILFMVCGFIGATAFGSGMPFFSLLFGRVLDVTGEFSISPQFQPGQTKEEQAAAYEQYRLENEAAFADEINDLALKFLYLALGGFVASFAELYFWELAAVRQTNRMRIKYVQSALGQDIAFYDAVQSAGSLLSGLSLDCTNVSKGIGNKIGQILQQFAALICGVIIAFIKGWKLALVMVALFPVMVFAGAIMGVILSKAEKKSTEAYAKSNNIAQVSISNIRTVTAYNAQERKANEYSQSLMPSARASALGGFIQGLMAGFASFVFFGTFALAMWYGSKLIRDGLVEQEDGTFKQEGDYTGGRVMTVQFSAIFGAFGLGQAAPHFTHIFRAQASAHKVLGVIHRKPTIDPNSTQGVKADSKAFKGKIVFDNVAFAYPTRPEADIYTHFSITIPAGKTVALVGPSGCGKSTAVQLIQRFYDPKQGTISIDGVAIKDYDLKSLRDRIGLVSQEPTLFATTIYENIAYGMPGTTLTDVQSAAKSANAHRFIQQLPEGYNTWVGESGVQLSGGQKQRIAIARAILKNPAILLLDEATSALDTKSEKLVQHAIDSMISGSKRTTVIIAHRLSTVRNADMIGVVHNGVVVETGTHDELINIPDGEYATLVKLQQAAKDKGSATLQDLGSDVDEDEELAQRVESGIIPAVTGPPVREPSSKSQIAMPSTAAFIQDSKRYASSKLLRPKKKQEESKQYKSPSFFRLFKYNKSELHFLVLGCIAALFAGSAMPGFSFLFTRAIKTFFITDPEKQSSDARLYALLMIAMGVYVLVAFSILHYSFGKMGAYLTLRIRQILFRSILFKHVGWFDKEQHSSGQLTAILAEDAASIRGAVGDVLGVALQNLVTAIGGLVVAFIYGWKMALVIIGVVPLLIFAGYIQNKFQYGVDLAEEGNYSNAASIVSEAIRAIRTVHSFQVQDKILNLYKQQIRVPTNAAKRSALVAALGFGFSNFIMFSVYALAFWFGGVLIKRGESNQEDVFQVFFGIMFAAMGATEAQVNFPHLAKAGPASKKVFQIIDEGSDINAESPDGLQLTKPKGEVELQNVTFVYPERPDVVVFNKFNLVINAGQKTALVGESGSGKSTVVSLIERFYEPEEGLILIDGTDVKQVNLRWLRDQIGLVSQEPVLFSGSLLENIMYGKKTASREEIQKAAEVANCNEFINELENGLDTLIGDQGIQLSGGQKQRVAIARAVIKNPLLLLLDEATSALDAASERAVQEALQTIHNGQITTLAIAHRLSTIKSFDKIAVVQRGVVIESGTHDQLMDVADGNYAQLVRVQNARS